MKKICILLILIVIAGSAFAEDKAGLRVDGGVGFAASLNSQYITATPEIMYDFGFIALGAGAKAYFGTTYKDVYAAPYAEVELGWLYLDVGTIFTLVEPDPALSETGYVTPSSSGELLPFGVLGLDIPLIELGPGMLGVDANMAIAPTATPVVYADTENILGDILVTIFANIFVAGADLIKAEASVYYTLTF